MKLVVEFSADDSGYSTNATIITPKAAEEACQKWCQDNEVEFNGLKSYEEEDDNGFFYSFSVVDAIKGAEISTGQYR